MAHLKDRVVIAHHEDFEIEIRRGALHEGKILLTVKAGL